jgi:hypothetical protein
MVTLELYFETIAGAHLQDAVDALRDSGSADILHDEETRTTPESGQTYEWSDIAWQRAMTRRVVLSRRALLYAALAAEAYINEFLWEHLGSADREALDRLPTVEKFIVVAETGLRPFRPRPQYRAWATAEMAIQASRRTGASEAPRGSTTPRLPPRGT